MFGCWGRILLIDLSKKVHKIIKKDESFYKKYIGGVGIATKFLFDYRGYYDLLSPDNVIVFAVGPYQATGVPGSGRWTVSSKSPLTGIFADSCAGGTWGPEFKQTGFDGIIIKGKTGNPVYLWITDGSLEIRDASSIWGKKASESEEEIREDLGEKGAKVLTIGPAGEHLVRFASTMNEHGVAGRAGMGAVMGSKNLKGIAVRGSMSVKVKYLDELRRFNKETFQKYYENTKDNLRENGSAIGILDLYKAGEMPIKNWTEGEFKNIGKVSGQSVTKNILIAPTACTDCPVSCHRHTKVEEPVKYKYEGYGPEYESIGMLGPLLMVDDIKAIGYMSSLCDEYGMDTITTGSVIALAMESYEKGWIGKEDLGMELNWGDADATISLIHMIANRKGFGNVLADGVKIAADAIGHDAPKIAVHVKGLDLPAHDPRAYYVWALTYATGTRGACHQRGPAGWIGSGAFLPEWGVTEEKSERYTMKYAAYVAAKFQDWAVLCNSLVQCEYMIFGGLTLTDQVTFLNLITGWDVDVEYLSEASGRILTLQRALDVYYGVSRKDDVLPSRIFEPLKNGGSVGKIPVPFEPALEEYYRLRGWDKDGKPTVERLVKLGLTKASNPVF